MMNIDDLTVLGMCSKGFWVRPKWNENKTNMLYFLLLCTFSTNSPVRSVFNENDLSHTHHANTGLNSLGRPAPTPSLPLLRLAILNLPDRIKQGLQPAQTLSNLGHLHLAALQFPVDFRDGSDDHGGAAGADFVEGAGLDFGPGDVAFFDGPAEFAFGDLLVKSNEALDKEQAGDATQRRKVIPTSAKVWLVTESKIEGDLGVTYLRLPLASGGVSAKKLEVANSSINECVAASRNNSTVYPRFLASVVGFKPGE